VSSLCNADEVARGLSPFDPSAGAIKAGRLLLNEIRESLKRHETFALESTLSGKTYIRTLKRALLLNTSWKCIICGFPNSNRRVRMGGHNVPIADIRRRFKRSLTHLIDDYLPIATRWAIWDNRGIARKTDRDFCDR